MNPPFGGRGMPLEQREVLEAGKGLGVENDLMKVGRFVELLDCFQSLGVLGIKGEGVRKMDLGDSQSGIGQGFQ